MTGRSTTCYCVFLGSLLISWRTKRQKTLSLSSAATEYRVITGICCELSWLWTLLKDLQILHPKPALLHCNNKAASHITANPVFHKRTKHIEMDCHFIKDKIQDGSITTEFVTSAEQLVDVFTKPLGKKELLHHDSQVGSSWHPLSNLRGSVKKESSPRGVACWQRAWDLHSRSQVRVRACTCCKSLGQPGFYSLTWAHKVRFPGGGVSSNPKKRVRKNQQNLMFTECIRKHMLSKIYVPIVTLIPKLA